MKGWLIWMGVATVAGVAVVAYVVGWPPFGMTPSFHDEGVVRFICHAEDSPQSVIVVSFSNEGRTADAAYDGRSYRLEFERRTWMDDVYRGGGATLTIDPEAHLSWPGGSTTSCQD